MPRGKPTVQRVHESGPTRAARGPRERLLDAADRLFYRNGIAATGIDGLLAVAGVAKQSLYDHFGGKDGLVTAYLARRDERFADWFRGRLAALEPDAARRFARVLDVLAEFLRGREFCGCAFIAAAEEVADPSHPAREVAARSKAVMRAELIDLARVAGARHPEGAGAALALLIDGVLVAARMGRGEEALADARGAVASLLAQT